MRLIDADAAIEALVDKGQASTRYRLGEVWELNGQEIREVLNALPSAQPERKKGKWINKDGGLATCSACGERWGVWSVMNYCPNCGANMRGEENE